MDSETEIPERYVYAWSKSHELSLDQFLARYKPSMVQDDGTKPWIWVRKEGDAPGMGDVEEALQAGASILKEATERVEGINKDDKIPTRSNKKTGARSKKELREEVQAKAAEELKKLSQEKKFTVGKWLFFAQPDSVDGMWSRIARSLVEGDLSKTPAWIAKVSTSKSGEERPQHLICLYLPDLYDKQAVTEVLKVLVSKVGLTPSSAKTDLYTHLGLDSKHPSGLRSTIWQVKELLSEDELKALRDEYTANQASSRTVKPKPAARKDDPFGDDEEAELKRAPAATKAPSKRKDEFDDDDEAEEKPAKKAKTASAPSSKPAAKKKEESETEYEDDDAGDDLVKNPTKKPAVPTTTSTAAQKPGASRLAKAKVGRSKDDD